MSAAEIALAISVFLGLTGAVTAGFWRMWALIKEAGAEGRTASNDLADYKLHVAETYATKHSVNEGLAGVQRAIGEFGERLDKRFDTMTDRLDRVIEANHKPVRRQG